MRIFFEQLELETLIGLWEWERESKTILFCDCVIDFDYKKSDNINDTVNYAQLADQFRTIASKKKYYLLEPLLEDLKEVIHQSVLDLNYFHVRITKKGVLANAVSCGVEDSWERLAESNATQKKPNGLNSNVYSLQSSKKRAQSAEVHESPHET